MCLFYLLWTGILWPVQLLCRAGTSERTMQCLWGSLQLLTKKGSEKGRTICKISPFTDPFIIIHYPTDRHSLPSSTPRIPHPVRTFTPTTTQNSGVARRGRAREGETAFATPSASPSRKLPPSKRPNLYPKNKKIKTYKKRDRQTNKVQQSQKRKKLFLFLHFLIYS